MQPTIPMAEHKNSKKCNLRPFISHFHERRNREDCDLVISMAGRQKPKNKIETSYLLTFRLRMDLLHRNLHIGSRSSETGIWDTDPWNRKIKNRKVEIWKSEFGIWGKVKIEKPKIGKMESGVKIMRIGISEREIRN